MVSLSDQKVSGMGAGGGGGGGGSHLCQVVSLSETQLTPYGTGKYPGRSGSNSLHE